MTQTAPLLFSKVVPLWAKIQKKKKKIADFFHLPILIEAQNFLSLKMFKHKKHSERSRCVYKSKSDIRVLKSWMKKKKSSPRKTLARFVNTFATTISGVSIYGEPNRQLCLRNCNRHRQRYKFTIQLHSRYCAISRRIFFHFALISSKHSNCRADILSPIPSIHFFSISQVQIIISASKTKYLLCKSVSRRFLHLLILLHYNFFAKLIWIPNS